MMILNLLHMAINHLERLKNATSQAASQTSQIRKSGRGEGTGYFSAPWVIPTCSLGLESHYRLHRK